MIEAVRNQDNDAVRALLREQVDVNAAQPDGATPLHWAVHWEHLELADLLIGAGAKVNVANDLGVTPLWTACENGSAQMTRILLEVGADPNAALLSGETLLMTAARTGEPDTVRVLLARGAAALVLPALLLLALALLGRPALAAADREAAPGLAGLCEAAAERAARGAEVLVPCPVGEAEAMGAMAAKVAARAAAKVALRPCPIAQCTKIGPASSASSSTSARSSASVGAAVSRVGTQT